jgi:hypothetical protein
MKEEDNMALWIKWSAQAHKDAIISSLSDIEFRAFVTILEVAKEMRKGGEFRDRRHLATVIGPRLSRCVPRLIAEGLLEVSGDGLVKVSTWSRWQVDPTSAIRQQRARAEKQPVSRFSHAIEKRESREREEKSQTLTNGVMSVGEIILRGAKR